MSVSPTQPHYVTVTFGDGRVEEFDMQISPASQVLQPVDLTTAFFTPRPGTFSSLVSLASNDLLVVSGMGPVELTDWGFNPYNPNRYQLITVDDIAYTINQATGLENIIDRNGNTITFTEDGIIHSAGKSVVFTRDAQGRITSITDPMGSIIEYEYDYYGDLVAVTDQLANTTEFTYNSAHGLVDIIDPRGVGVARNVYDDDGRLIATIDAEGNRIDFVHNIGTRQEVVTDRLGNVSVYEYDDFGNVVSETDALGNRTDYTYDSRGNQLTKTDALGNTTTCP
jgi:YD repeat-containing protein